MEARLKKYAILGLTLVAVITFFWGVLTAQMRIFPYNVINKLEMRVFSRTLAANINAQIRERMYSFRDFSNIVIYGDSHVELGEWASLFNRLDITNRGISGETTEGLLRRLQKASPKEKTVVVLTGTNDVDGLSEKVSEKNVRDIVSLLQKDNKIVLLSTPYSASISKNDYIRKLNVIEKEICNAPRCSFADINAVIAPSGLLEENMTIDGVHLTPVAYEKVRDVVLPFFPD